MTLAEQMQQGHHNDEAQWGQANHGDNDDNGLDARGLEHQ
jgi:hypothetical protein